MAYKTRLKFCRGDLIAIAAVIVLTAAVWGLFILHNGDGAVVEIYKDGELIRQLPLSEDAVFTVEGEYTNVVAVSSGKVAITESDCPGGDCMHSGAVDSMGRSIVCLPNRVEIRINGAPDADGVDFVVG